MQALLPAAALGLHMRLRPARHSPAHASFSLPHLCSENLRADEGAQYDQVIEINLSELEPQVNGPFTPDLANPLSKLAENARREGWPLQVSGETAWVREEGIMPACACPPCLPAGGQHAYLPRRPAHTHASTILRCSPCSPPAPPSCLVPCSRPDWLLHQLLVRGHDARRLGGQAGAGRRHQGQGALRRD